VLEHGVHICRLRAQSAHVLVVLGLELALKVRNQGVLLVNEPLRAAPTAQQQAQG
jgi:hypothetical protein